MQTEIRNGGLYSTRIFRKGEVVIDLPPCRTRRNRWSIESEGINWDCENSNCGYINHRCRGATLQVQGLRLIAAREILPGDELTINYLLTETEIAEPFTCWDCGQLIEKEVKNVEQIAEKSHSGA